MNVHLTLAELRIIRELLTDAIMDGLAGDGSDEDDPILTAYRRIGNVLSESPGATS